MRARRFRAMGTEIELLLEADEDAGALAEAEAEFRRLEALLSRFRPDSELARLNRAGSATVGPELLELVALALGARERSGGRFDPTVHDALVAAGYDRSFELVGAASTRTAAGVLRCGGRVVVDAARSAVELEPGVRLDLGGIAKGWAADRVLALLRPIGPALVNAGGDVAAAGRPWPVGVPTARGALTLELRDGGLATSGRDRRRWLQDGRPRHHLIDPATGAPAESELVAVTVAAPSAAEAETLATGLFLAGGAARAAAEAAELDVAAVLVTGDGAPVLAGTLA